MITFEADVDLKDVQLKTLKIAFALSGANLTHYLRTGGVQILQQRASARFGGEGDDASGPWAELRPKTQAVRRSLGLPGIGPAHPINVRTGALRDWLASDPGDHLAASNGVAYAVWPGPAPSAKTEEKFETAQMGKGNTRRRPVARANQVDLRLLLSGLGEWLETSTGGLSFS